MFKWLKKKLGIDQLEEQNKVFMDLIKKYESDLETTSIRFSSIKKDCENWKDALDNSRICLENIRNMFEIGADIHLKDRNSWAVICMNGKPEYVKFVPLQGKDARMVIDMLRQFSPGRRTIDSPLQYRGFFNESL